MNIFIDTWGFISLYNKKEFQHKDVVKVYKEKLKNNYNLFTSDYILDETITLIFSRFPINLAMSYIETILELIKNNDLKIIMIYDKYFNEAVSLRKKYKDKPDISFTDLTSIAVMKDLQIKEILSADKHFLQVGLDLTLIP